MTNPKKSGFRGTVHVPQCGLIVWDGLPVQGDNVDDSHWFLVSFGENNTTDLDEFFENHDEEVRGSVR